MKQQKESGRLQTLTRRALILGGIKSGLLLALAGRLYYLQVLKSDRFATLAEENRISLRLVPSSRGKILDRFGQPLALNVQSFRLLISAEKPKELPVVLNRLSRILPLTEEDRRRIIKNLAQKPSFTQVTAYEGLNWEQVSTLEVNAPDLPGTSIEPWEERQYPLSLIGTHIVGYVGAVSEAEQDLDPVFSLPDFRIGKSGVEKQYEEILRGEAGTTQLEVNAVGRVVREISRNEGEKGEDVTLAIDEKIQQLAQQRLTRERSASLVALHVHTGEIYAMASHPSYDPHVFTRGLTTETWKKMVSDPATPLINKSIAGQYAPGSTFKMIVALAALEAKIVALKEKVICKGHMNLGNQRFHCWKPQGHGPIDLVGAIIQSCDIFFYEMASRLGIDRITNMALRFGLGEKSGIDLPGEKTGLIPTSSWRKTNLKQEWQTGETLVSAIGQGYTLTTPLQLAVMTARLVNGGYAVQPRVTLLEKDKNAASSQNLWPSLDIDPHHLEIVHTAMNNVTMSPKGTAYGSRIAQKGFEMGGKTGTAQVRRISMSERARGVLRDENLAWASRDHALFVGYAPIEAPRFACAVVVEHGGHGSSAAAPIARDILLECQKRSNSA